MTITVDETKKLANLSKLKMTQDELEQMTVQIQQCINFIDQLSEVDVSGVDLSMLPVGDGMPQMDDIVEQTMPEVILSNAPEKSHNMYVVNKVVE